MKALFAPTLLLLLMPLTKADPVLVSSADGGWTTTGLPYTARISATGQLQSLRVGTHEFLPPGPSLGLYLAAEQEALPFTAAAADGNTLRATNSHGSVAITFAPDGLQLAVANHDLDNGHCLRLDIGPGLERLRALGRAEIFPLPLPGSAPTPLRLIGRDGATLSLGRTRSYDLDAGGRLQSAEDGYLVVFPWVAKHMADTFFVPLSAEASPADKLIVEISSTQPDFTFWDADPQALTVAVRNASDAAVEGKLILRLRSYLTKAVVSENSHPLSLAPDAATTLAWPLSNPPPMLYLAEVWVSIDAREELGSSARLVYHADGLLAPAPPADFDDFWAQTLAAQQAVPVDLQLQHIRREGQHEVYKFSFAGLLGYRCYGWLTLPTDTSRTYPGELVLPPAGMRSQPVPLIADTVGMRININTVDVDLPADAYDWATWPAPYLVSGILDRDRYCLRFGYAAIVRAAEILASRPEVDSTQLRVSGSSQGGGLVFVAAGLCDRFVAANANKPGLCRLDWNLDLQPAFFPIAVNEQLRPGLLNTLQYFLPSHFARRISCPLEVRCALYDDVTPAVGVFCAYNAVPGTRKRLIVDAHGGH